MSDKTRRSADVPTGSAEPAEVEKSTPVLNTQPILNTQTVEVVSRDGTVLLFRYEGGKVVIEQSQHEPVPEDQAATAQPAIGPTAAAAPSTKFKSGQSLEKLNVPKQDTAGRQTDGGYSRLMVAISHPRRQQTGTTSPEGTPDVQPVDRAHEPEAAPTNEPKPDK